MPKKKAAGKGKKKAGGKKKTSSKKSTGDGKDAAPEAEPVPGPGEPHADDCACQECRAKQSMVRVRCRFCTNDKSATALDFTHTFPDWTAVYGVAEEAAGRAVSIVSDLTVYKTREQAEAEESPLQLDDTLHDIGFAGGSAEEPTECTLWFTKQAPTRQRSYYDLDFLP